MGGDASAFAALGLEPGADRDAIERAYRRLIKHHHPDRAGGDAQRAAEITQAYRELREDRLERDELIFHDQVAPAAQGSGARAGGPWLVMALVAIVAIGATLIGERSLTVSADKRANVVQRQRAEPMRGPIALAAVDAGVRDALRIARSGDEMTLTSASRACHDRLRDAPSLALLDRCAAFDDAVVLLQDRDPLRDRGRFSELAVTGRQWSAAKGLSDDFVAIDGRLDQVRLRVELMLAGRAPERAN